MPVLLEKSDLQDALFPIHQTPPFRVLRKEGVWCAGLREMRRWITLGKKAIKILAGSRRGEGIAGQSIRKRPASLAYQSGY